MVIYSTLLVGLTLVWCSALRCARAKISDAPEYLAVLGSEVNLPCNTTSPVENDTIALVLWYRGDSGNPIYSVDARSFPTDPPRHFASPVLGSRARFNVSSTVSLLQIRPLKDNDGGEYKCRVDFKKERTKNQNMRLSIIVPAKSLSISDAFNKTLSGIIGPFKEGGPLKLICRAEGGQPPPAVSWWKESILLDDSFIVNGQEVYNELHIPKLSRQEFLSTITCQASNTNLTIPVSTSVTLDLHRNNLAIPLRKVTSADYRI